MRELRDIINAFRNYPLVGLIIFILFVQVLIPIFFIYLAIKVIQRVDVYFTGPGKIKKRKVGAKRKLFLKVTKQFLNLTIVPVYNFVLIKLGKEPITRSTVKDNKPKVKQYKRLDGKPSQFGIQVGCPACGLIQPAANHKCSSCSSSLV